MHTGRVKSQEEKMPRGPLGALLVNAVRMDNSRDLPLYVQAVELGVSAPWHVVLSVWDVLAPTQCRDPRENFSVVPRTWHFAEEEQSL